MRINFYESLLPLVYADLPGPPPRPQAEQELHQVINEFLRRTQVWKIYLDPIYRREGTTDYELDGIPDNTEIERVVTFSDDGNELLAGVQYTCPARHTVRLAAAPSSSKSKALTATVALRLKAGAYHVDCDTFERIWDEYRDAFRWGFLARMQAMPGQTWSNPEQAVYNGSREYQARERCRLEINRQMTRGRVTASAPSRFTLGAGNRR